VKLRCRRVVPMTTRKCLVSPLPRSIVRGHLAVPLLLIVPERPGVLLRVAVPGCLAALLLPIVRRRLGVPLQLIVSERPGVLLPVAAPDCLAVPLLAIKPQRPAAPLSPLP
jgi:hypothetical protein